MFACDSRCLKWPLTGRIIRRSSVRPGKPLIKQLRGCLSFLLHTFSFSSLSTEIPKLLVDGRECDGILHLSLLPPCDSAAWKPALFAQVTQWHTATGWDGRKSRWNPLFFLYPCQGKHWPAIYCHWVTRFAFSLAHLNWESALDLHPLTACVCVCVCVCVSITSFPHLNTHVWTHQIFCQRAQLDSHGFFCFCYSRCLLLSTQNFSYHQGSASVISTLTFISLPSVLFLFFSFIQSTQRSPGLASLSVPVQFFSHSSLVSLLLLVRDDISLSAFSMCFPSLFSLSLTHSLYVLSLSFGFFPLASYAQSLPLSTLLPFRW